MAQLNLTSKHPANAQRTHINLLPTEILVEIFKVFQVIASLPPDDGYESSDYEADSDEEDDSDEESDEADSWRTTKDGLEWLIVTTVCRHWYDVATHTPALWQVIDVYFNVEWLKLCLKRSEAAPLDIRFHDMDTAEEAEDFVVPHASRISKLHVLADESQSAQFSLHYLEGVPMPHLEEFNVVGGSAVDINASDHPRLAVLRAEGLDIDWKKLPNQHLRVLDLESSTPDYDNRLPSLDTFLRILGSLQRLEELTLNYSIPLDGFAFGDEETVADYWRSSRMVSLPRLRKLDLTSGHSSYCPSDTFALLSHLRFAPTTSVALWMGLEDLVGFRGLHGLLPRDSEAFPFLRDATSAHVLHSVETLIFIVECAGGATLSVRYEMCAGGYMKDAYPPDAALSDFCALFSSSLLTQLTVDCHARRETFMQAFRTFTSLCSLTIDMGGRQRDFNRFLSAFQATGDQDGCPSGLVLPALRNLRLASVPWRDTMLDAIASRLGARAACGAAKLSMLDIEIASRKGVPDDEDLDDMLEDLEPFVEKRWGLMCYNC